jgi:hypothetical protein
MPRPLGINIWHQKNYTWVESVQKLLVAYHIKGRKINYDFKINKSFGIESMNRNLWYGVMRQQCLLHSKFPRCFKKEEGIWSLYENQLF